MPGHFSVLRGDDFNSFYEFDVLPKYVDDEVRMRPDLKWCAREVQVNPHSRQLIVNNFTGDRKVPACFNMVQFVRTHRKEYDMYVYQRSSDLKKWTDDVRYFIHIKDLFQRLSGIKVTKIVIVYGNVHYQKGSSNLELGKRRVRQVAKR